jgi:hypothetical protein
LLLEELISKEPSAGRTFVPVVVRLDKKGRRVSGLGGLMATRHRRYVGIGVQASSKVSRDFSSAGDDRVLRIEVAIQAVIDDVDAAERAAVASSATSWMQALNAQVDAAFNEASRGGNRFLAILALCGEEGAALLFEKLAPKLSDIGLTLISMVAHPVEPGASVLPFKRSLMVETDADPISIDISFSLERDPQREVDYYTSVLPSQTIAEKLHTALRDYLERRFLLQQWRFDIDLIRTEIRQFINERSAQFGRRVSGPLVVNSPEERANRPLSINGKSSTLLLGRDIELSHSASIQLTDAATWERLKRNDPVARDMTAVASSEVSDALARILKREGQEFVLNLLLNKVDLADLSESIREEVTPKLRQYGWAMVEIAFQGKPFPDSFLVRGSGNVTLHIQDYSLGLNRGSARIGVSVSLRVVDPSALLNALEGGIQSVEVLKDSMKVAIQDVVRTTTAGEFFDFGSTVELKIADAVRGRLADAIENSLSELGVRLTVASASSHDNTRGITFRLETNPALERLSQFKNSRHDLKYGESVKDVRGVTYPIKFDIRMIIKGLSENPDYKEIFIDHALKQELPEHIEGLKQTVEDSCVAVLRRIPANYYYRENLRTTRLDGFLATVLMERIENYHGVLVDIPPGHITIIVDDSNNMSAQLEDARRDLKRQALQSAVSIDAIDDGETERRMAMIGERLEKLTEVEEALLEGELGGVETFEGLRDNLYPYLQYIADDQNVHGAAKAFLDRQGFVLGSSSKPDQISAVEPHLQIAGEESDSR